ncbi:MAG: ATP--guanido phosphotransferase [Phycisphaerales bacterium]|nr:ATP--guanido phosphotransferase [Phycisphaerales bacterium]
MSSDPVGPWLGDPGPDGDVVVSVRVRLARNLAGFPFVWRATDTQRSEIVRTVTQRGSLACPEMSWHTLGECPPSKLGILVERHLVSQQFIAADGPRCVGIAPDDSCSVMVNEEDHLRIQALRPGNRVADTFTAALELESSLASRFDFAYHERWGFLTACPTNVGCGIRISAMMHLPALRMYKELDRVKRAAKDLNLAIRGFYGEGSETVADFYQVSNQITLGVAEADLMGTFSERIVPRLVEYERETRAVLLENRRMQVEDLVVRALAILQCARLLTLEDAMKFLGRLRFGISIGLVQNATFGQINRLMLAIQPAHLAASAAAGSTSETNAAEVRDIRAEIASAESDLALRAATVRMAIANVTAN